MVAHQPPSGRDWWRLSQRNCDYLHLHHFGGDRCRCWNGMVKLEVINKGWELIRLITYLIGICFEGRIYFFEGKGLGWLGSLGKGLVSLIVVVAHQLAWNFWEFPVLGKKWLAAKLPLPWILLALLRISLNTNWEFWLFYASRSHHSWIMNLQIPPIFSDYLNIFTYHVTRSSCQANNWPNMPPIPLHHEITLLQSPGGRLPLQNIREIISWINFG